MASLQQIISWFKEGLFPNENQFRQTWLSYWHKSEKIPQTQVFGLQDSLDTLSTGMIYKEPVQNLSDLATTYPNPQKGWSVQVINEKNADGNSLIYQWDGTQWNNTGMVGFPANTVKKAELDEVKDEIAQLGRNINEIDSRFVQTANLYDPSLNVIGQLVNHEGNITNAANWEMSTQIVEPNTEYVIRNGDRYYEAGRTGQLQLQTSSGVKISSVNMASLPDYKGGRVVTTPANCGRAVFNVYGPSTNIDFRDTIEWYKGKDTVPDNYITPRTIAEIVSLQENIEDFKSSQESINNDLYNRTSFSEESQVGSAAAVRLDTSDGYWNQWPQLSELAVITKISLNAARVRTIDADCSILIAQYNDDNTKLVATQIIPLIMPAGQVELDVSDKNITVPAGHFALLKTVSADSKVSYGYGTVSSGNTFWFPVSAGMGTSSNTFASGVLSFDYAFSIKIQRALSIIVEDHERRITVLEENPDAKENEVSIDTVTDVMFMGSSLTSSHYQSKSHSWIERLNDMVDVVIINNGVSGQNLVTNMNMLVGNTALNKDSGNTPKNLKTKYIWWNNSANGTPAGVNGMTQLRNAMEITASYGAKMLLGSEEDYSNISKNLEDTYRAFSAEWDIPYSPMIQVWRKCYPANNPYKGWIASSHAGYRAMAPYNIHRALLEAIPIGRSVKMFKVRTTYKGGTPTISDLAFDDNDQRLKYFTAISAGAANSIATNAIDNLDNHAYDVPGGDNTGVSTAETSIMKRSAAVSFNKFVLIEFILDNVKITKGNFEVTSNVNPLNVYIAVTKNPSTSYTDAPRTEFVATEFTYAGGKIIASIVRDDYDIQRYDKVRIIIEYNGAFSLTNPKFYAYDGVKKVIKSYIDGYQYRRFGTELNPLTSFPLTGHGWALGSGAAIRALPDEIANYTSYNGEKSHLQLSNDNATATKTINIDSCTKVAVRVIACIWPKLATTRFAGTAIENSEYIDATAPQVRTYDYDYGTLRIRINDNIIRESVVMQGWHEIYFEIDVNPTDTALKIELGRKCFVDNSYTNADKPIFIHDISVQKFT